MVSREGNGLVSLTAGDQVGLLPGLHNAVLRHMRFAHHLPFRTVTGTGCDDAEFRAFRPFVPFNGGREVYLYGIIFQSPVVVVVYLAGDAQEDCG